MVMLKAFYKETPKDKFEKISVEYSIDTGYYCTLRGVEVTDELLACVSDRMKRYIDEDVTFEKKTMSVHKAIRLFDAKKMFDKSRLLRYRRSSRVTLHKLGKVEVENVGQLNDVIVNGGMRDLMLVQEALHEKEIGNIAEQIASSKEVRVVTIAGPSSSGKTTFSYRLSAQLKTFGLKPHPIGLDDYFVNRVDTPKDKDGKYNYECIEAIDTKQFNEDLENLLAGREVQLPTYNFITGKREYNIHGLNDKLTEKIPKENKFKIYISALTTLNVDDHNRIPTTDGRLIRRIVRDARTRGHSAQKTIAMWKSVRDGENTNIFPFQEKADAMFNSSLLYELAALKTYAEPALFRVPMDSEEYAEAQRLLKFLDYFLAINPEEVPLNSIVREFIGGGILLD